MKKEYIIPNCLVVALRAKSCFLSISEQAGTARPEDSGGELGSRSVDFDYDDE
jgi:hypothetical protein